MEKETSKALRIALRLLQTVFGAAIYAVGIAWFFRPVSMVSGGVTGIAMVINLITHWPVGVMIIILNIPLFILALKKYGLQFMLNSLVGMAAGAIFIDLLSMVKVEITTDPLLAAIYGGVITGLGCGIVYSAGSTQGGTDVLSKLLRERLPYINFGTFILAMDAVIVAVYALLFKKYDIAMYTVIAVFIATKVIDTVLYGVSQSKLCHIISEYSEEIKADIVSSLHRGVTMLNGKGAYSGQPKQILLCVVKRQQIVEIKRIVKNIDKSAFVIITDTRDVFGKGFTSINSNK